MSIDLNQLQKENSEKKPGSKANPILELLQRDISFSKKGLSDKQKERFYSALSVLINSGIDLASSLQIIVKQEKNKKIKNIYEALLKHLIKGEGFSVAMQTEQGFTEYEYYSVMIGEESGTLSTILTELFLYYKTRLKQRRQITGALTYPILVMVVAISVVIFMLNVIVPMFAGVFQRFGGELPSLTKKIMALSNFFSNHSVVIFLSVISVVFAIAYIRKFEFYRRYSASILLRLPIFGELTRKIFLSRFCNSLQLLVASRAPIIDALEMIDKMIRFYPLNKAIQGIQKGLTKGRSLNDAMQDYPIFDAQLTSLIKVGEETGKLEQILHSLYEQYTEEIEYRTSQMGNLMEPLLIIGVGIMVMIILIAMYLPLFQLSTSII